MPCSAAEDGPNDAQPMASDDTATITPNSGSDETPDQRPRQKRALTSTEEIDHAIRIPASVRINVKGAFIVESRSSSPSKGTNEGGRRSPSYETSDIRLPHHNGVVSHIAVDVCTPLGVVLQYLRGPLTLPLDWRNVGQAGLLLSRAAFDRSRRTT